MLTIILSSQIKGIEKMCNGDMYAIDISSSLIKCHH
jgi:hypothetical protein